MSWMVKLYGTKKNVSAAITANNSLPDALKKYVVATIDTIKDIDPNGGNWEQADHVRVEASGYGAQVNILVIDPYIEVEATEPTIVPVTETPPVTNEPVAPPPSPS